MSYQQPVDKVGQNSTLRSRHAQVIHMLDTSGTLSAKAHQGLRASRFSGIARSVAFVIGIAMSVGATPADGGQIDAIEPKHYIRLHYSLDQAKCLIALYGKESAFNSKAIGNEDGINKAYGIPQLKSKFIKDLSANKQIDYGMKYITHRYKGQPCLALSHSNRKGWY